MTNTEPHFDGYTSNHSSAGAEIADLYDAFLVWRDSDAGVDGFRQYLAETFPGEPEFCARLMAEFAKHATPESQGVH